MDSLNRKKSKPAVVENEKKEVKEQVEAETKMTEEVKAEPVQEKVVEEKTQEQKPVIIEDKETKHADAEANEVINKPMEEKKRRS